MPECDILVHCGDMSADGGNLGVLLFLQWFASQPGKHKVLVAGNHDWFFQKHNLEARSMVKANCPECHYLQDEDVTLDDLSFWGSPYTPTFLEWYFMEDRGPKIKARWDLIPKHTDVLVTHGPAYSLGDKCPGWDPVARRRSGTINAGCKDLLEAVYRVRPLIHASGHIHAGHGVTRLVHPDWVITTCINASVLDEVYRCTHVPILYDL